MRRKLFLGDQNITFK